MRSHAGAGPAKSRERWRSSALASGTSSAAGASSAASRTPKACATRARSSARCERSSARARLQRPPESPSRDDLPRGIVGGVVLGQHIMGPFALLPLRHRRLAIGLGHEAGPLDQLVFVDVARAVRENLLCAHAPDEL